MLFQRFYLLSLVATGTDSLVPPLAVPELVAQEQRFSTRSVPHHSETLTIHLSEINSFYLETVNRAIRSEQRLQHDSDAICCTLISFESVKTFELQAHIAQACVTPIGLEIQFTVVTGHAGLIIPRTQSLGSFDVYALQRRSEVAYIPNTIVSEFTLGTVSGSTPAWAS